MATIEHLYTRFEMEKRHENKDGVLCTLACYKCNNLMGIISQSFIPVEILRERSKRHKNANIPEKNIISIIKKMI